MKFKIENCENKKQITIETFGNTNEDPLNIENRLNIIESALLFIIDNEMDMDTQKVIEEIFYQRGLYDILEDAIEEAERLKNNH